jgi:hypothetical protein
MDFQSSLHRQRCRRRLRRPERRKINIENEYIKKSGNSKKKLK